MNKTKNTQKVPKQAKNHPLYIMLHISVGVPRKEDQNKACNKDEISKIQMMKKIRWCKYQKIGSSFCLSLCISFPALRNVPSTIVPAGSSKPSFSNLCCTQSRFGPQSLSDGLRYRAVCGQSCLLVLMSQDLSQCTTV